MVTTKAVSTIDYIILCKHTVAAAQQCVDKISIVQRCRH